MKLESYQVTPIVRSREQNPEGESPDIENQFSYLALFVFNLKVSIENKSGNRVPGETSINLAVGTFIRINCS